MDPPHGFLKRSRLASATGFLFVASVVLLALGTARRKDVVLCQKADTLQAAAVHAIDSGPPATRAARSWQDSLGDGFPDEARLDNPQDRENFIHWLTFLAEVQYYVPTPQARIEVRDCAALLRYAYRNALMEHSAEWSRAAGLPFEPGFGDIAKFHYPDWPLRQALFRTEPGPLRPGDFKRSAFAEFADSSTLLRYNTFRVSRDLDAARPGDLLFFCQPGQREPYHTMLFVGRSYFQPQGSDWIVYHTGDIDGRRGEVREVEARTLIEHPDPRWRPLVANPSFLGVYRFEILR